MRDALDGALQRIAVGETVKEIIGRPLFQYAQSPMRPLYRVRGFDLGYQDEGIVSLRDIYQRASEPEYDLGPAKVGPKLRLACLDQPADESWIAPCIAMGASQSDRYAHGPERARPTLPRFGS
jgi:hypothetical protein